MLHLIVRRILGLQVPRKCGTLPVSVRREQKQTVYACRTMLILRNVKLTVALAAACALQAPPASSLTTLPSLLRGAARGAAGAAGAGDGYASATNMRLRLGCPGSVVGHSSRMRPQAGAPFTTTWQQQQQDEMFRASRPRAPSRRMIGWDDVLKLFSSSMSSEGETSAEAETVKKVEVEAEAEATANVKEAEKSIEAAAGAAVVDPADGADVDAGAVASEKDAEKNSSDSSGRGKTTSTIPPFTWPFTSSFSSSSSSSEPKKPVTSIVVSKPQTSVVVTGATGRVGQLTVRRLLELYPNVLIRALVNDLSKGREVLKEEQEKYGVKLEIMLADLRNTRSVRRVVSGASAVVFCESGFAQNESPWQRIANAVRLVLNPNSVADVEGVKEVALALKEGKKTPAGPKGDEAGNASAAAEGEGGEEDLELKPLSPGSPRFVLLSSAAVTRPTWSAEEKAKYPAAAEVPIVKLNPLNILTVKAAGEKELRESGVPYAVLRPCGLNDDHPRGRPIFSVGDLAAGRICREDVAELLARCLSTPEATGKTFEVLTIPGLDKVSASPAKASIGPALATLPTDETLDGDAALVDSIRQATYPLITQLRPVPLSIAAMRASEAE